jgi:hypothetical protein
MPCYYCFVGAGVGKTRRAQIRASRRRGVLVTTKSRGVISAEVRAYLANGNPYSEVVESLVDCASSEGFHILVASLPAGTDGDYQLGSRTIRVCPDLSSNEKLYTLVHELTHALVSSKRFRHVMSLHGEGPRFWMRSLFSGASPETDPGYHRYEYKSEIIADMVAFGVCEGLGMRVPDDLLGSGGNEINSLTNIGKHLDLLNSSRGPGEAEIGFADLQKYCEAPMSVILKAIGTYKDRGAIYIDREGRRMQKVFVAPGDERRLDVGV